MSASDEKLNGLLNASGFAYQLGLEAAVLGMKKGNPWHVTSREHSWRTETASGFIDMVLSNGNIHLVIECKRTRDATWMFLMPDKNQMKRSHARICWTDTYPHQRALTGWGDVQVYPACPESEFCAIRGQGEGHTPLLERLAASVVESSDGLAADFLELTAESAAYHLIVPVIVTNASLLTAAFDPRDVDLGNGELKSAEYDDVPYVRFRKSLGPSESPIEYDPESLEELAAGSERTVFVVHGPAFTQWLADFQTEGQSGSSPWVNAREAAKAMAGVVRTG